MFYLIQRGKTRKDGKKHPSKGIYGIVELDYMGSAEFEFGTLPRSLNKLVRVFDNLAIVKTEFRAPDGRRLYIVAEKDRIPDVAAELATFLKGYKKIPLKEPSYLPEALGLEDCRSLKKTDFWWSVDHSSCGCENDETTDWFAFLGRSATTFRKALEAERMKRLPPILE